MHEERKIHPQTRLLVAGTVGVLVAILDIVRIWLPTLSLLGHPSQFSLLVRAALLVKFLSPVLSFLLAGGWIWLILLLGEQLLLGANQRNVGAATDSADRAPQEARPPYRPERLMAPSQGSTDQGWENRRQLAAPPLFQLDPTHPWSQTHLPTTPLPLTNPAWSPHTQDLEEEEEARSEETGTLTQAEQVIDANVGDVPPQQEEQEKPATREEPQHTFSLQPAKERSQTPRPVTLTLLKQIRCWLRADDGASIEVKLRGGESAIRLIQLAHIAWRQGAPVDRDKMLTHVIARGKRQDMNTDQLGEVFDSAKRYLRQDVDRAIKELHNHGHQIADEIDFFSNEPGFYWLHSSCRVADLEQIEEHARVIQMARKEGLLDEKLSGAVPDWVIAACQSLLSAYPGDFLQSLLEKFPEEFGAWVKEPVTLYRDKYLEALLIMANHESALGRTAFDAALTLEQNEEQRRHHSGRAAHLFYDYAMYAINSRWDQKLKFAYRAGKDGERVVRAERAIRRCVVEIGKLGNPDMIDQAYLAFKERMSTLSERTWKPDPNTESDVLEAKRTTSAYRFSSQIPSYQEGK